MRYMQTKMYGEGDMMSRRVGELLDKAEYMTESIPEYKSEGMMLAYQSDLRRFISEMSGMLRRVNFVRVTRERSLTQSVAKLREVIECSKRINESVREVKKAMEAKS